MLPKKPDGTNYPPGTIVKIPGKNGTTIVVTIGENGKGTIPNNELPDGIEPGKGTITEPGKEPVEVIVTTPAKIVVSEKGQPVTPDTNSGSNTTPNTTPTAPSISKEEQIPAQEPQTPSDNTPSTGEPVQQTQDTKQNILPNTGTADGLGIFSAAAASILSGLGLVVFGKKEDEEEENN